MRALLVVITLSLVGLAGCIQSDSPNTPAPPVEVEELLASAPLWTDPQNAPHGMYGWPTMSSPANGTLPPLWTPLNGTELPATITGLDHEAAAPEGVASGAGIAMFGSIAYVPGFSGESYVLNVSDPLAPELLATVETGNSQRGAAMIAYPDGKLVAVVSTGPGFDVVNLTDPWAAEIVAEVEPTQGGHKLGVVPGTPIVYNAASNGGGRLAQTATGVTEIYDLTDPENPEHVQDFPNGFACHHIYFWNNPTAEKYRAVCAGLEFTQIWDTADPLNPEVIVNVPVHHGVADTPSGAVVPIVFSHFSILSEDGTVLIVGDEMGGGGLPPGCVAGAHTPAGSASTPFGALWFYDVSDETNPILLGWFSPGVNLDDPNPLTSCTAHHGRLVPAEGRDLLAIAFYDQGVVLVDFTNPRIPVVVDQFNSGTNTWEVWYNQGYLFTGDLARGFDVFAFE